MRTQQPVALCTSTTKCATPAALVRLDLRGGGGGALALEHPGASVECPAEADAAGQVHRAAGTAIVCSRGSALVGESGRLKIQIIVGC
jgi:hypothetical protein